MTNTAPGWYPADEYTMRYWDGMTWVEGQTRPRLNNDPAPAVVAEGPITLSIFGYIFAAVIPIIGAILGIVAITRPVTNPNKRHGLWIILASIAFFVLWFVLLAAIGSTTTNTYQTGY